MPLSPPPTPRTAHFLGRGPPPRQPGTGESDRDALLTEDRGEGPSRARSVSLAQSIASITSFVSAASSTGLSVSRGHSRQASATGPGGARSRSPARSDTDSPDSDSRASFVFSDLEEDLDYDYNEEDDAGSDEPLVRRSSSSRRRKYDEQPGDRSLWELIPPLILAHPLALFPALAAMPYDFLPAGVALFIPLLCVIAMLSACAHIVIVYLAWYLKVRTFEDVFAACAGERFGPYALGVGRAFVMFATMGASVGWLGTLFGLFEPLAQTYLPEGVLQSRVFWVLLASTTMIPALVPSRTFRSLRKAPFFLALLLPIVAFIAIGRTVEVRKLMDEGGAGGDPVPTDPAPEATATATAAATAAVEEAVKRGISAIAKRGLSVRGLNAGSAGSGLTSLAMFFTPHLQTLSVHSTLQRNARQRFFIPCFATTLTIVVIALPFALVPYYLLPPASTGLAQLPKDDGWTNAARVLMAILVLGSTTSWLLRGRDCVLVALDVDRGERIKAGRWVGLGMWAVVVLFACIGGVVAEKIELMGVMATLAVGWLMPSLFFIITFHVRSPLSIIFPRDAPPPPIEEETRTLRSASGTSAANVTVSVNGHMRTASLDDPATDVLLARKERQLQKRRLGRRLWQDMVVYVGILPVGCVTGVWAVGSFLGLW